MGHRTVNRRIGESQDQWAVGPTRHRTRELKLFIQASFSKHSTWSLGNLRQTLISLRLGVRLHLVEWLRWFAVITSGRRTILQTLLSVLHSTVFTYLWKAQFYRFGSPWKKEYHYDGSSFWCSTMCANINMSVSGLNSDLCISYRHEKWMNKK